MSEKSEVPRKLSQAIAACRNAHAYLVFEPGALSLFEVLSELEEVLDEAKNDDPKEASK